MNNLDKYLNILKSTRLTSAEKSGLRANLEMVMKVNPERISDVPRHTLWRVKLLSYRRFSMPALIAALIIALSGGTAAAANTALPGDALFPVKQAVEKVRFNLTGGNEGKASVKLVHLEKRLEEAEKLAVEGKLDAEVVSKIEANFNNHEETMKELIAKLEAEGNTEAAAKLSSNLEASLTAHAEILAKLKAKIAAGEKLVDPTLIEGLRKVVSEKAQAAAKIRAEREDDLDDDDVKVEFKEKAAAGIQKAAQHKIDEVKRYIEKAEARLGTEAVADAKAKIVEAEKLMVEGKAKLDAKAYADAFVLFQKAHRSAQAAKITIHSENELKLDVGGLMRTEDHRDNDDDDKDDEDRNDDSADLRIKANGRLEVR